MFFSETPGTHIHACNKLFVADGRRIKQPVGGKYWNGQTDPSLLSAHTTSQRGEEEIVIVVETVSMLLLFVYIYPVPLFWSLM